MKQYIDLLKTIREKGSYKEPAREGMPGTTSLFGHQFRQNLQEGFPLLTTKKMYWKGVVVELLWFLRGDTNIKYLIDNKVKIWSEDAYNYYLKVVKVNSFDYSVLYSNGDGSFRLLEFEEFVNIIETVDKDTLKKKHSISTYTLGDCGYQYGRVWRRWDTNQIRVIGHTGTHNEWGTEIIDQLVKVVKNIQEKPYDRRKLITAVDPSHDEDLALYWCHALFQFNCRKLSHQERVDYYFSDKNKFYHPHYDDDTVDNIEGVSLGENSERFFENLMNEKDINVPKYYLDCQLYQRSADVFLGVPFNIASYALLTHIIAKICNMVPGEFIHTFGDVHIYDNHNEAVDTQLMREPNTLPKFKFSDGEPLVDIMSLDNVNLWYPEMFQIENYQPQPKIEAQLSTGLKK